MKYAKMLALLAVAAVAAMAFAATASATTVTSPKGTAYTGVIKATNEGSLTLHGVVDITCNHSEVEGSVESHGAGVTAKGAITKLTFTQCNQHVTIISKGSLEAHQVAGSTTDGTLTSSNAKVTVVATTIFGAVHCVFATNNTHIGRLTATAGGGSHATLDIDSSPIPVVGSESDFLCGSSSEWTGNYKVNTPTDLHISA
ncbi:MAG TPA: hypothetical protein VI039_13650 [Solirubrobacterales bacterium]